MSQVANTGEQSTSTEIEAVTNLVALETSGTGEFIRKTGPTTFENATPSEAGAPELTIQTVSGTINGSNTIFTIPEAFSGKSWLILNQTILIEDVHYTVSGTTITYFSAPPAGMSGKPHKIFCFL